MWNLKLLLRQRLRHWPSSLAFIAVIGSAIAVAGDATRWGLRAIVVSCLLSFPISMALGKFFILDGTPVGWDPTSWIFATTALGLIGLFSSWIPARRAALADPAAALRTD